MSFVIAGAEQIAAAVADVSGIEAAVARANAAAALPTTALLAAADDEVSAAIAEWFGEFGLQYLSVSGRVLQAQTRFTQLLSGAQISYSTAEAAITASLASSAGVPSLVDDVLGVINAPATFLLGRPLIGDGVDGTPGTGQAGGPGGLLWGNGGAGGSGAVGQRGG
ncbi:PE family protein, partial [Mycobacterium gordonae]|uniref:PE family protein n=3 Tax=Mycobacteriaceae TaxID=1762 RepID=UPI0018D266F6